MTSLSADKVERLGFYNLQELLEDDNLTYKIIRSCVSLNSAITEITKEDHPELSKSFFETANYLYPFGILTLSKIKKMNYKDVEKEFMDKVSTQTSDYINFMKKNGVEKQSFIKDTFIGDDLDFCNEMRSAIEITKEDYPDLSKSFFETANYLYPFGILTLSKIKKMNYKDVEKECKSLSVTLVISFLMILEILFTSLFGTSNINSS